MAFVWKGAFRSVYCACFAWTFVNLCNVLLSILVLRAGCGIRCLSVNV